MTSINVNVTPTTAGAPAFSRGKVAPPTGVRVISDVRVMADDFEDIQVTSWFATSSSELARNLALSLTYQGNQAQQPAVSLNVNLRQAGTLPDGRRRWSTTNRPDPRYGNIFVSQSIGEQRYDGLVAVLTKRFSAGTSFQLSHHLSKSRRHGASSTTSPASASSRRRRIRSTRRSIAGRRTSTCGNRFSATARRRDRDSRA